MRARHNVRARKDGCKRAATYATGCSSRLDYALLYSTIGYSTVLHYTRLDDTKLSCGHIEVYIQALEDTDVLHGHWGRGFSSALKV